MSNRRPSHIFPESKEAMSGLLLLYSLTLIAVWALAPVLGLAMIVLSPKPSNPLTVAIMMFSGFAAVAAEITAVAIYRHYRYVIPFDREAAHHCPSCDYDIGEEHMEGGCPECGWLK